MYLTRIALNAYRRDTVRALATPSLLHGAVARCFEDRNERALWRTDIISGTTYLLILSASKPDCSGIAKQFGAPEDVGKSLHYDPLLALIADGQRWRFRLRANPVVSETLPEHGGRGRVRALANRDEQKSWLMSRANKNGFSLSDDEFDVMDSSWKIFKKKNGDSEREVTLLVATFEGVLTVTDASALRAALTCGIGRAKAYGCGLLTIMGE